MMISPIVVDCPRCHRPLPPVNAAFGLNEDLRVTAAPILWPAYFAAIRRTHPNCVEDGQ